MTPEFLSGKKRILTTLFLTALLSGIALMYHFGIQGHEDTIERLSSIYLEYHARNIPHHLPLSELEKYRSEAREALPDLQSKFRIIAIITCLSFLLLAWHLIRYRKGTYRYDALALIGFTLLSLGFMPALDWMTDVIPFSHNPSMEFRMSVFIAQFILTPALFFLAWRWNKSEITAGLHTQQWISILAFTLGTLSGIISIFIGLAVLFTPNLGGNIT